MSGGRWDTNQVPAVNSDKNSRINDVIGNKNDTHDGDSLYSKSEIFNDHFHKPSNVYPTLAGGVTITSGAGAWLLGSFSEIIPASTIVDDFDIHYIGVESISNNFVYELHLFAVTTFIGAVRFTKTAVMDSTMNIRIQTPIIPANTQIQAKIASASSGSETADVSLFYHIY